MLVKHLQNKVYLWKLIKIDTIVPFSQQIFIEQPMNARHWRCGNIQLLSAMVLKSNDVVDDYIKYDIDLRKNIK